MILTFNLPVHGTMANLSLSCENHFHCLLVVPNKHELGQWLSVRLLTMMMIMIIIRKQQRPRARVVLCRASRQKNQSRCAPCSKVAAGTSQAGFVITEIHKSLILDPEESLPQNPPQVLHNGSICVAQRSPLLVVWSVDDELVVEQPRPGTNRRCEHHHL